MEYPLLKSAHILSLVLLFGTGLGSAFYKYYSDRSGNLAAIAVTNRLVVFADWLFTTPTVIIQPVTGFLLLQSLGMSWQEPWVVVSLILYAIAGGCWVPVVWLQIRMRDISATSLDRGEALPECYHRDKRIWFWLGVPAFICMVLIVFIMIFKPEFW